MSDGINDTEKINKKEKDHKKNEAGQDYGFKEYLQDLESQLDTREKTKITLENQYYQILGQIQLLKQQISNIKSKITKSES